MLSQSDLNEWSKHDLCVLWKPGGGINITVELKHPPPLVRPSQPWAMAILISGMIFQSRYSCSVTPQLYLVAPTPSPALPLGQLTDNPPFKQARPSNLQGQALSSPLLLNAVFTLWAILDLCCSPVAFSWAPDSWLLFLCWAVRTSCPKYWYRKKWNGSWACCDLREADHHHYSGKMGQAADHHRYNTKSEQATDHHSYNGRWEKVADHHCCNWTVCRPPPL